MMGEPCGDGPPCMGRRVCEAGVCVGVQCLVDDHCIAGEVCHENRCVVCAIDEHCGENGSCIEGACLTRCDDDAGCGDNQVCNDNVCVDVECRDDAGCAVGVCESNVCEPCRVTEDCVAGTCGRTPCQCVDNECVGCQGNDDCPAGVCNEGLCVDCIGDPDCAEDRFCVNNICGDCRGNDDCQGEDICLLNVCQPPPPGDTCNDPLEYEVGTIARGNTAIYQNDLAGSCSGGGANDVVYAFVAAEDGTVCATTRGSTFDTVIHAFGGACDAANRLSCDDDDREFGIADGTRSTIEFDITAGTTYYVVVDGFGAANGDYILSSALGACADVIPPACLEDAGCGPGQICRNGNCGVACDDGNPCMGNAICDGGACRAVACLDDDGCADNFTTVRCVNNRCLECGIDDHCEAGETCSRGTCTQICQVTEDCDGFREACLEGLCTDVECINDDNCFGGVCENFNCIDCRVAQDCPANSCNGGPCLCVENTCVGCEVDADCGEGNFCIENGCRDCRDDADCGEGTVCGDGFCVECREDAECGEDGRCVSNQCFQFEGGESCEDALPYQLGTIANGTNAIYRNDHDPGCAFSDDGFDVVYQFEAAEDGTVCATTRGSDYDTVLFALNAACDAEVMGACDDDDDDFFDIGLRSTIEFPVVAGATYFLVVDGFSERSTGIFRLSTSNGGCLDNPPPICLADADCPQANICRDNQCVFFCQADEECDARQVCDEGACLDVDCRVDGDCGEGRCLNNECVQCIDAEDCGEQVCGDGACVCAANACVECAADADCDGARCNANSVCVECLATADCAEGNICFDSACVPTPAGGGICESPIDYSLGEIFVGSVADGLARDAAQGCLNSGAGQEKVHRFTVQEAGPVCIQTRGSSFDTALYVRTGQCFGPDSQEVACNDNSPLFAGAFQSAVSFEAQPGTDYFVIVDAFFAGIPEGTERYVLTSRAGACEGDPIPICADDIQCEGGICVDGECIAEPEPEPEPEPLPAGLVGVILSEYVEGSGNNKAIEIYNGNEANVALNACELRVYNNGGADARSIALAAEGDGIILPGDAFVLCNGRSDAALLEVCDQTSGSVNFTGNDSLALACGDHVLDIFGQIGFDPGDEWSANDVGTADTTLRRACEQVQGDVNGGDIFDPSAQWNALPIDTFDGLGAHCPAN